MFIKTWWQNIGKRLTYQRWIKVREGIGWHFVHPWERRFVEDKLKQNWREWSGDEARELLDLLIVIGHRMIEGGLGK